MTEKLDAACIAVAAVVRGVTGIRQTFDYAPDSPNAYPVAVVYPATGNYVAYAIGTRRGLHDITIDVLEPQQMSDLARFMAKFIPFVDTIPAALLAEVSATGDQFSNTIETLDRIDYSFLPIVNYAADPMRGYRFIMRGVKILTT
jgi:hypothetical protein